MTADKKSTTFFRQSGWLMMATVGGGVFMWAVHFLSKPLGPTEYGIFGTFLALAICVPTMPLQMVFAQQTAKALATNREHELSGAIRAAWVTTLILWLIATVVVLALQSHLLARWKVANPLGLWITLAVILFSLWRPILWGVLQGQQNFLWLGW